MVTFIKKIKTKEGVNSINLDKVKKDIPAGYQLTNDMPAVTYTANHIIIAYNCTEKQVVKPVAKKAATKKSVAPKKAAPAKA